MSDYNTNLKEWGAAGEEYPDGYKYEVDVPPVDVYDNYLKNNIINDVQHLVGLTNDRIESDKGASGGEPTSPEASHIYHDQDDEVLELWNTSTSAWETLASESWVLDNSGVDISEDGSHLLNNTTGVNFSGDLNVSKDGDGTVTVSLTTTSYSDEEAQDAVGGILSGNFTYDDENNAISLDSPLGVDIAGDADTVGGKEASELGRDFPLTAPDNNGDGTQWSQTEDSTTGDYEFRYGGAPRHEFAQNGDVRIEGELTENASL